MDRRTLLQMFGGGIAALALPRSASGSPNTEEFFILVHAAGGWDVTLWSDPRNERRGLVEPASSANTDHAGVRHWKSRRLDGDVVTFEPLVSSQSALRLGPAVGDLYDLRDRLTIVNGIAMNTVSHDDGTAYSVTGRHQTGGTVPSPSIDVVLAHELGVGQAIPAVSVRYPSWFVGKDLDRRAIPLRVPSGEAIIEPLERSDRYFDDADRRAITSVLLDETRDLEAASDDSSAFAQLATQHAMLPRLLSGDFKRAFGAKALQAKYPTFDYRSRSQGMGALNAAFALEAFSRDLVRCIAFGLGGLDTHAANYRRHAITLQDLFDVIATLVKSLDAIGHPTRAAARLADHTHILVLSEFCRSPRINLAGGRDHHPNNSALVISPRFRGGRAFGTTDEEELLPASARSFSDGARPIAPPDLLATFLAAFGIDARRHYRDGEVVEEMLG